jgi:hypothetical protein
VPRRRPSRYPALDLGPLPIPIINAALGTELDEGNVRLSQTAHQHMAEDHAADYPVCIKHLASVVSAPTYVGQAPGHARNFEMIGRIGLADGRVVLVAIGLEPDGRGDYAVKSAYLLEPEKVQDRRIAGRLKIVRAATKAKGPA